jgi:signal peptide peptidase SppA
MLDLVGKFINGTPWAITPQMLNEIRRIYFDHLEGKKPDIKAIEAALGRPLTNEQPKSYEIVNGVAVISLSGLISKRMNLFMEISGGLSIEKITAQFKEALADSQARALALIIDSPGGGIDGVFELAELIYTSRDVKPVISVAYGTMASAAYLIGAAASVIYATDVATAVGSIGVIAVHEDRSAKDAASGIIKEEIYRGKYKRIIGDGPLTEEGRLSLSEKVDYYYTLFIDAVARYRGVSSDTVLAKMSTDVKDYFIGQQAVEAGLIDGIMTRDDAISQALTLSRDSARQQGITLKSKKEVQMDKFTTLAELVAAYPDFAAQLRAQGVESVDIETLKTTTAQAETERIIGLAEAHFGKEESDRFAGVVKSGSTVEQYAAFKAANPAGAPAKSAEDREREKILAALKETGAKDPGHDSAGQTEGKDFMTLVDEYMAANKVPKLAAMQAIINKYPEKHSAYITEANKTRRSAHV